MVAETEPTFSVAGLEYDLETFAIVAVSDFNMGKDLHYPTSGNLKSHWQT